MCGRKVYISHKQTNKQTNKETSSKATVGFVVNVSHVFLPIIKKTTLFLTQNSSSSPSSIFQKSSPPLVARQPENVQWCWPMKDQGADANYSLDGWWSQWSCTPGISKHHSQIIICRFLWRQKLICHLKKRHFWHVKDVMSNINRLDIPGGLRMLSWVACGLRFPRTSLVRLETKNVVESRLPSPASSLIHKSWP